MRKDNTLSNLCNTYDLQNLVCGPTCSKGAQPTALDVILSSEPKRFKHTINEPCFLSDFHNVICTVTKLLCPPIVPRRIYYRSYKHFDEESYVRDLYSAPFVICDIFDDPDDKAWCFTKVLSDVMEKNAPVKSKVIKKPQIPYMNSKLRKAMHRRNMLRNKYKKGLVEWDVYRIQRNITTSIYKKSQATYFSERCEGGAKNQKFWRTIKPFLTSKQPSCQNIILKEDDKIITDEREICDIFNDFFSHVAMDIGFKDDIPDDFKTADGFAKIIDKHSNHPSIIEIRENIQTLHNFYFTAVNDKYIEKLMQRMDPKKAQGYDSIPSKLLRIGASGICSHVSQLVNHCFRVCEFPDIMKLADVSSLYKKNDTLKKDNYRPVSVLPSLSKVYERVMGQQLSDFFDKIFSALLSAFRKRYSCQSTLLNMIEHFKRSLDNGEYVACLSMDLSKAFDCLPHCLTICKLYSYGVSREACTLIASYLRDRKQRIKLGSSRSEWTELFKGVPQGSILGPLIFNIFLNDIFYFVSKGDLYNYADDNCISVSHKDISVVSAQLENETQIMTKWFADNSMKANVDKFQGIILSGGRNNTAIQVSLDDVDIAFVQKIDVLGVCIDGKLNFNEHVCRICSKASAQISALQRLTGLLDYPSRKAIYTSFIASNFNYCPLVWFFTSRESIDKIDKIQERALRFVLKDHISDYTNLLLKSGFDSFRIYAVKCLMIELFKILKGITPNYLSDLFVKADNPYDTRDKYKLIQPLKRTTTYGLRSFQYYGAHVWNMLSINIKAAHSLHEFKSLIRSWPGPKYSCHICIALLWLMSLLCIAHCGGGLSVWRLCGRLWYRVAVTTTCGAVESS